MGFSPHFKGNLASVSDLVHFTEAFLFCLFALFNYFLGRYHYFKVLKNHRTVLCILKDSFYMNKLKVIELFAGVGTQRQALKEAGINHV